MRGAVFLDRDGVINQALVRGGHPFSPASVSEFAWVAGIHAVAGQLHSAGFQLFCVTNQPDVGRGFQDMAVVEELHQVVMKELPLEKIYTCYHDGVIACDCRKPKPGLILEGASDYGLDLEQAWLVGDRWKDIDAGNTAGCQTVFVDYGYDEHLRTPPDHVITDIKELPGLILTPQYSE